MDTTTHQAQARGLDALADAIERSTPDTSECPSCGGEGTIDGLIVGNTSNHEKCYRCDGNGRIDTPAGGQWTMLADIAPGDRVWSDEHDNWRTVCLVERPLDLGEHNVRIGDDQGWTYLADELVAVLTRIGDTCRACKGDGCPRCHDGKAVA